ncbi:mycofactocin precursor [Mycobacterium sp. NS-7484]|nr:mycofactocin precursor [Mycobacterium sp. E802]OMB94367.1 mycofactocin precursor [Mycobacterium sp. NS-7484]
MSRPTVTGTAERKVRLMDQNPQTETETQLVTETLVEEVSIDGMCGVY